MASTVVLLEVKVEPEKLEFFHEYYQQVTPKTLHYEGCQDLKLLVDQQRSNEAKIVETWESRNAYEKYLTWRTETGVMDKLAAMLVAPPSIRFFDAVQ